MSFAEDAHRDDVPLIESLDASEEVPARRSSSPKAIAFAALALAGVAGLALAVVGRSTSLGALEAGALQAAPRELQQGFCNPQVQPPLPQSPAFDMPGDWWYTCHGQGAQPVPPPPSEVEKYPGEQNWCWNWMKHKGCKDVVAKSNWKDAQQATFVAGLAPDPSIVPMVPVQNPELCEDYNLGATVQAYPQDIEAAKAWLAANVAIYVITLPAETERQQFMQTRMDELGIQFSFLPGVDLRVPGSYAQAKTDGIIPMDFNYQAADANIGDGIAGMVGCASAHLSAMLTITTNGQQQPLAVVLENDVRLEDDFAIKLYRLVSTEVPCDWEVVSLKSACPFGACITQHLTRVMPDPNEPEARCRHGVNYGFWGMLYKVQTLNELRAKITQRVWNPDVPHCLDIDVALASISDTVAYYAVPYWQAPGLLQMGGHGSTRNDNDNTPVDTTEPR